MLALKEGRRSAVSEADSWEVAGVNSRIELAEVEAEWQRRRRLSVMHDGTTLIAPETVFFSHDTLIGKDVLIEHNVVFGPRVVVEDNATIHAFSPLEGAHVKRGAEIGPSARTRPGAEVGQGAKVGSEEPTSELQSLIRNPFS